MDSTTTLSDQIRMPAASRVCAVHGRGQLDMVLELTAAQLGVVRNIVRGNLELWGVDEDIAQRALLVVHELLANIVQHTPADPGGRHPATLLLQEVPGGLSVVASDRSTALPTAVSSGKCDESGRGWLLVQALADDVSVSHTKSGKDVWAQVDTRARVCLGGPSSNSAGDELRASP